MQAVPAPSQAPGFSDVVMAAAAVVDPYGGGGGIIVIDEVAGDMGSHG